MLRRQFVPAALGAALAVALPSVLGASAAPTVAGNDTSYLHFRATRRLGRTGRLELAEGENLRLTVRRGELDNPRGWGVEWAYDDCAPERLTPREIRSVARALRSGALVLAVPPSADDLLRCIERQMAALNART